MIPVLYLVWFWRLAVPVLYLVWFWRLVVPGLVLKACGVLEKLGPSYITVQYCELKVHAGLFRSLAVSLCFTSICDWLSSISSLLWRIGEGCSNDHDTDTNSTTPPTTHYIPLCCYWTVSGSSSSVNTLCACATCVKCVYRWATLPSSGLCHEEIRSDFPLPKQMDSHGNSVWPWRDVERN